MDVFERRARLTCLLQRLAHDIDLNSEGHKLKILRKLRMCF